MAKQKILEVFLIRGLAFWGIALWGLLLWSFAAQATIYGKDDFMDVLLTQDEALIQASRSVAIRTIKSDDILLGIFHSRQFKDRSICLDQRFVEQPIDGACTGFLVAPDLIMTAGHCVLTGDDCRNAAWVFDYVVDSEDQSEIRSVPQNVYSCKERVRFSYANRLDYAVIRLDRPVEGRQALTLQEKPPVHKGMELTAITAPQGLPLKYSRGVVIDDAGENFFATNVDVMRGSSGGPIFNAETMEVVGLVAQGEHDFKMRMTDTEFCNEMLVCPETGCEGEDNLRGALGEDVTRISQIPLDFLP